MGCGLVFFGFVVPNSVYLIICLISGVVLDFPVRFVLVP